mmetsp:Transcript_7049/g.18100  ORF Transcript_7049/g.18100 Transcript_7049/m.18100 type:complete len:321 (+) Transcript_7049:1500-2462(+)
MQLLKESRCGPNRESKGHPPSCFQQRGTHLPHHLNRDRQVLCWSIPIPHNALIHKLSKGASGPVGLFVNPQHLVLFPTHAHPHSSFPFCAHRCFFLFPSKKGGGLQTRILGRRTQHTNHFLFLGGRRSEQRPRSRRSPVLFPQFGHPKKAQEGFQRHGKLSVEANWMQVRFEYIPHLSQRNGGNRNNVGDLGAKTGKGTEAALEWSSWVSPFRRFPLKGARRRCQQSHTHAVDLFVELVSEETVVFEESILCHLIFQNDARCVGVFHQRVVQVAQAVQKEGEKQFQHGQRSLLYEQGQGPLGHLLGRKVLPSQVRPKHKN